MLEINENIQIIGIIGLTLFVIYKIYTVIDDKILSRSIFNDEQ
jgi:hypothetical protein